LPDENAALKFMHKRSSSPSAAEARDDQLQRTVIVGQLVGGMLHDFNNVLTVITGTIGLLAEAVADRPELSAITKLIDDAATRGAKLTSQLLVFARGQPSQPSEIDVNAVIDDASRLLRATLGMEIEIVLMLTADLPPALTDAGQLTAAILSLAIIARDAMPDGGTLTFRTGSGRIESGLAAAAGALRREDAVVIGIHARGMAGELPSRIFSDVGIAEDFVGRAGGLIKVDQAGAGPLAEVVLPTA
jgi:nitrogen-specific signal transduction histidine kinase